MDPQTTSNESPQAAGTGRLADKTAIVTGASQGIGRAVALAFAREGANVVASGRSAYKLDETARLGGDAVLAKTCDVRDEQDVAELVRFAVERFGRLDVMCNNAGILKQATLVETSSEMWDETMEINVRGTFFGCKHAIPAMIKTGRRGSIINIGSINSFVGEKLASAYVASKGAVLMLTKNAAAECAEYGIRVNLVCPAAVNTPMNDSYFHSVGGQANAAEWMSTFQPLVPILEPDDIASAAVFLGSDESRAMTGSSLVVDGGLLANWDHVAA